MLKTIQKHGVTLAIFTAILTGLTAMINKLTKNTINKKINHQQAVLFNQVIPSEFYDNDLRKSCFIVDSPQLGKGTHRVFIAHKDNRRVGAVMEATAPDGYSGSIQLLIATDFNGMILGTRVTEHHETPGLGDKIELRLGNWILDFTGKIIHGNDDSSFAIKRDGGDFNQFTGATVTPRSVVNAVKRAVLYAKTLPVHIDTLPVCEK